MYGVKYSVPGPYRLEKRLRTIYWEKNPRWYLEFKKFPDEEFKPIKGYKGIYFISNYGQLISFYLTRPVVRKYEFFYGYFRVCLTLLKKSKDCLIHNLVYTHFVGPIPRGNRVIHKNNITTDNYYKNLVLVPYTHYEMPVKEKRFDFSLFNRLESESPRAAPNNAAVLQFDKKGNFIREFSSFKKAAVNTGLDISSLRGCCLGKRRFVGNYQWRYKSDPLFKNGIRNINSIRPVKHYLARAVLQFDLQGHFIKEYPSMMAAAKALGIKKPEFGSNGISSCARGRYQKAFGFQWRFKNDPIFANDIINIGEYVPHYRKKKPEGKKILRYSLGGIFLKEYTSLPEAALDVGISSGSIICAVRKKHTAGGFQWRYKKDVIKKGKIPYIEPYKKWERVRARKLKPKPVLQFDKNGKFIRRYDSILEAAYAVGINDRSISESAAGLSRLCAGFQWRFLSDKTFKKGIVDIDPV